MRLCTATSPLHPEGVVQTWKDIPRKGALTPHHLSHSPQFHRPLRNQKAPLGVASRSLRGRRAKSAVSSVQDPVVSALPSLLISILFSSIFPPSLFAGVLGVFFFLQWPSTIVLSQSLFVTLVKLQLYNSRIHSTVQWTRNLWELFLEHLEWIVKNRKFQTWSENAYKWLVL